MKIVLSSENLKVYQFGVDQSEISGYITIVTEF